MKTLKHSLFLCAFTLSFLASALAEQLPLEGVHSEWSCLYKSRDQSKLVFGFGICLDRVREEDYQEGDSGALFCTTFFKYEHKHWKKLASYVAGPDKLDALLGQWQIIDQESDKGNYFRINFDSALSRDIMAEDRTKATFRARAGGSAFRGRAECASRSLAFYDALK